MIARLRKHLTYANVLATACLFVVLGGGAYAATQLPKNSVGAKQLKKGAVTPAKISKQARKQLRGNAGPAGPSGAGPAFEATLSEDKDVGLAGEAQTPVLSLSNLPAGSYAVFASAVAGSGASAQFQVLCSFATDGAPGSGAPTSFGSGVVGLGGGQFRLPTLVLQQVHTFTASGGNIVLRCSEGGNPPNEHAAILTARITAIQVQSQSSVTG